MTSIARRALDASYRLAHAISTKQTVRGLRVAVFWESGEAAARAVAKLDVALGLLEEFHPRVYNDMRSLLPRILVTTIAATAECIDSQGLCLIDGDALSSDVMSAERVASILAHETMHARLSRAGFDYSRTKRIRVERVCLKAELQLAARLPHGESIVAELNAQMADAEQLWSTASHRTRSLNRLRDMGSPEWLIRLMDRISRLRQRRL